MAGTGRKVIYNFYPGPAMLPPEVLRQAGAELYNWRNTGLSVVEISHRSPNFIEMTTEIEQDCRELLQLPNNYHVLFLSGGARGQFAAIPMNLAAENTQTAYVVTGLWSQVAAQEAHRYAQVKVVADSQASGYTEIAPMDQWQDYRGAAYLHYTDNETVNGIEFPQTPLIEGAPLICDMSSSILSRPVDVTRFGLIYAGAQKNLGIAGLTLIIIRDDLATRPAQLITPTIFNYATQIKHRSMYNTPPTFAWYMMGLILKWLKGQGGMIAIGVRNQRKSQKLYQYIDQSDFYRNAVKPAFRSRMNVVFSLPDTEKEQLFIKKSQAAGLIGLKGHSTLGGIRASLYNAMPESGVDALIDFMREFLRTQG
jgi:phosphoserine aminotransferase